MKEQIRQNRGLLMLLAVLLVICLAAGLNTKSVHAASAKPALSIGNQGIIFTDGSNNGSDGDLIKLTNLPKNVVSIKWSTSNKKVVDVQEYTWDDDFEDENPIHTKAFLNAYKAGKTTVSARITYLTDQMKKEIYTAKKTIIVKKPALKSVKIKNSAMNKAVASQVRHLTNYGFGAAYQIVTNDKGKLKVTPKKGWKISSVILKDGKSKKKVKNGTQIKTKKSMSYLQISLKDTKTKTVYKARVYILKYNTWKITYGKMKKNTAFYYASQPNPDAYETTCTYKKNAKKSDYWSFKSCKDLAKKLGWKAKGNVITVKEPCIYKTQMKWINGGAGCKVERTRP